MNDIFPKRILLFQGIILSALLIFSIKLISLQLLDDKNRIRADKNSIKNILQYPNRGQIYDRNGKLLVENQNIYEVTVSTMDVEDDLDVNSLCEDLGIDTSYYWGQFRKADRTSRYIPYSFVKQIETENYQRFNERAFRYKGFDSRIRSIRKYHYPNAALLFGSIGEVDSNAIKKYAESYTYHSGDYIGKSGLEYSYEEELRGQRGVKTVLVDAFNKIKGSYANGDYDKEAIAGYDLNSTIDIELQALGEKLLKNKSGAVVAIEPKTGEVLAICSSPSYDPNFMTGSRKNHYYPQLITNKYKPLYNRAIQGMYPPGSTFKALVGLVAMQMNAITPYFGYSCPGYYSVGRKRLKCSHRHPSCRNIVQALTQSCNPYFFQTFRNSIDIGNNENRDADYNRWRKNIMRFGVGKKLNIDLKNEKRGNVPDTAFYNRLYKGRWKPTTIISLGIGQGEILMTPLQMANSYCIIANEGYYITPHLVKKVSHNGKPIQNHNKFKKITIPIDKLYFEKTIDGLEKVVSIGTARRAKINGISLCGKTGTSQNPHGKDHSVFVGFAPKEDPKIVIACIVENGGSGGNIAAPIVSLMAEKYIKKELPAGRKGYANMISKRKFINFKLDAPEPKSTDIQ